MIGRGTMKAVAERGGTLLLTDAPDPRDRAAKGVIFNPKSGSVGPEMLIQAILARGYWQDVGDLPQETLSAIAAISTTAAIKGDKPGHAFHGNQYTQGLGPSGGPDTGAQRRNLWEQSPSMPESGKVPAFKSMADCHQFLKDKGVGQTDEMMASLTSAGATAADMHHICGVIDKFEEQFPGLWNQLRGGIEGTALDQLEEYGVCAVGREDVWNGKEQQTLPSTLYLNETFFNAVHDPERFTDIMVNPDHSVVRSADDLMTHEVGHAIQSMALDKLVADGKDGGYKYEARSQQWAIGEDFGPTNGESPFARAARDAGFVYPVDGGERKNMDLFYSTLGFYASTSPREMASEVFVLMRHPDLLGSLSEDGRKAIDTYISSVNKDMGQVVIKEQAKPGNDEPKRNIIACTFFPMDKWRKFNRAVAEKESNSKPTLKGLLKTQADGRTVLSHLLDED